MNIEICVTDKNVYDIAKSIFADTQNIKITLNSIVNASYPVIISAGNSFAEMNGGVDGIINTHLSAFTPDRYIQSDVKEIINKNFYGELPVGQSIIIPTNHNKHKFLIYSPTMRVAENVENTINSYLAFRSALILMEKNKINYASTPLFCSGAGGMSIRQTCYQMLEAYNSITSKNLINKDWKFYHTNHRYIHNLGK